MLLALSWARIVVFLLLIKAMNHSFSILLLLIIDFSFSEGSNSAGKSGTCVTSINLFYEGSTSWIPLPRWAHFFMDVGIAVATHENIHKRAVVGLALPARGYAVSLVAFGVTMGRFASINRDTEATKRFQRLCELKSNTPLFYRKNGKLIKVFFDDIEEINGETKLRLNTKTKGERYWITSKQALQVEFPAKEFSPLPKRSSRRVSTHPSQFLSSLFDTETARAIVSQSSLDSLTIGPLHRLQEETQTWPIAVRTEAGFVSGLLQDVIRVRRFSKRAETYRSEIYHLNSKECENIGQEIPTVVIFESGSSFLRWRNSWRQSDWVVLFDQTEAEFDVAIQTFNEEYITSPVDDRELSEFPVVPAYISTAMYQEARQ